VDAASVADANSDTVSVVPDSGAIVDDAAPPPSGDGSECADLGCFDLFDCVIFHLGNECGFTACENFICVK
jgi:hypothetical protein